MNNTQKSTLPQSPAPPASELLADIGRVLHANTSLLVMVRQTLNGVIAALGGNPQEASLPILEESDELLVAQAARTADAVEKFLRAVDSEHRLQALPAQKWERFSAIPVQLRSVRERVALIEYRVPTLRNEAREILQLCRDITPGHLPRELLRQLQHEAETLEREACLIETLTTQNAVIQMDLTLRSLRDFVTTGMRPRETARRLVVRELIEQSIKQMADFAKSSRVEMRWHERDIDAVIVGNERELVRAFSNLLHNAIKYSWRRERATPPWIKISTIIVDGHVQIEFENWGVPIEREEIESGQVFEIGYRGKWATDRGRLGTGIGLTDAKRVAEAHGGELHISSRPASFVNKPDDESYYQQPFITNVQIVLPLTP